MAWSLYLTSGVAPTVTDAQLAELDEFELVARGPPEQVGRYLRQRVAHITHALVCAAGAMPGRQQMLRSVKTLQSVLDAVSPSAPLLRSAVQGLAQLHLEDERLGRAQPPATAADGPPFLRPLVNIAVNRVSDKELSGSAASCLSVLLGCPSFDLGGHDGMPVEVSAQADEQTRRLVRLLITEIVLTASPVALKSLSALLRRDFARDAFCEKDGVSTLASTLLTHPARRHTAIGEIIASTAVGVHHGQPVSASYHAVFAIWMLSFAASPAILERVLSKVLSSRLLLVLSRLLNHASGQRLKIARVTLSSFRNLASGSTELHMRVRRDLIAAEVPAVLERLKRMASGPGALLGTDEDAMADARELIDLLESERNSMSTLDAYVAEVRAGALHWSPVHKDVAFWVSYSQRLVDEYRDIVMLLAEVLTKSDKSFTTEICVACNDLAFIMRESVSGKAVLRSISGLKASLMQLMISHEDADVRTASLTCTQLLLISSTRR